MAMGQAVCWGAVGFVFWKQFTAVTATLDTQSSSQVMRSSQHSKVAQVPGPQPCRGKQLSRRARDRCNAKRACRIALCIRSNTQRASVWVPKISSFALHSSARCTCWFTWPVSSLKMPLKMSESCLCQLGTAKGADHDVPAYADLEQPVEMQ